MLSRFGVHELKHTFYTTISIKQYHILTQNETKVVDSLLSRCKCYFRFTESAEKTGN